MSTTPLKNAAIEIPTHYKATSVGGLAADAILIPAATRGSGAIRTPRYRSNLTGQTVYKPFSRNPEQFGRSTKVAERLAKAKKHVTSLQQVDIKKDPLLATMMKIKAHFKDKANQRYRVTNTKPLKPMDKRKTSVPDTESSMSPRQQVSAKKRIQSLSNKLLMKNLADYNQKTPKGPQAPPVTVDSLRQRLDCMAKRKAGEPLAPEYRLPKRANRRETDDVPPGPHFGEHSVHPGLGVLEKAVHSMDTDVGVTVSPFVGVRTHVVNNAHSLVAQEEGLFQQSHIYGQDNDGNYREQVTINHNVMNAQMMGDVEQAIETPITYSAALEVGEVPKDGLTPYKVNDSIQGRALLNELRGALNLHGNAWEIGLIRAIQAQTLLKWDNQAIYAKGFYYMLCAMFHDAYDEYDGMGPAPAWNLDNAPVRLQLGVPQAQAEVAANEMANYSGGEHIVLVQGHDFEVTDHAMIWALADGGNRSTYAANNTAFAHSSYRWEPIQFALMYTDGADVGGPMPAPGMARPSHHEWRHFLFDLAHKRGEQADMVRGLYAALRIFTSHWIDMLIGPNEDDEDIEPAAGFLAATCFHEGGGLMQLPRPRDWNWVYRMIIDKKVVVLQSVLADIDFINAHTAKDVVDTFISTAGIVNAAATTTHHSYSISGGMKQAYIAGEIGQAPAATMLDQLFVQRPDELEFPALILVSITDLIGQACGFWLSDEAVGARNYCPVGVFGPEILDLADHGFAEGDAADWIAYRRGNPLAAVEFFKKFPVEWGITGLGPSAKFNEEFILSAHDPTSGWYSQLGSRVLDQHIAEGRPHHLDPYAALALNIMFQQYRDADPPELRYVETPCNNKINAAAADYQIGEYQPEWIQELRIFAPCTIPTMVWPAEPDPPFTCAWAWWAVDYPPDVEGAIALMQRIATIN